MAVARGRGNTCGCYVWAIVWQIDTTPPYINGANVVISTLSSSGSVWPAKVRLLDQRWQSACDPLRVLS